MDATCCNFQGTHSQHFGVRDKGSGGLQCWAFVGGSWSQAIPPALGREEEGGRRLHRRVMISESPAPPFLQGQRRDRPGPRQGPAGAGCLPGQPTEGAAASGRPGEDTGAEGTGQGLARPSGGRRLGLYCGTPRVHWGSREELALPHPQTGLLPAFLRIALCLGVCAGFHSFSTFIYLSNI